MKFTNLKSYLLNCFLLIIPILLFNVIFASSLPKAFSAEIFWKDIPPVLATGENILRGIVLIFPFLMPLKITTARQKAGLILYIAGTLIYFLAWSLLIVFPQLTSSWFAFAAPAYTPLLWLFGIGLIGDSLYFPIPYKWWYYIGGSLLFVIFHVGHTTLVYLRTQ